MCVCVSVLAFVVVVVNIIIIISTPLLLLLMLVSHSVPLFPYCFSLDILLRHHAQPAPTSFIIAIASFVTCICEMTVPRAALFFTQMRVSNAECLIHTHIALPRDRLPSGALALFLSQIHSHRSLHHSRTPISQGCIRLKRHARRRRRSRRPWPKTSLGRRRACSPAYHKRQTFSRK